MPGAERFRQSDTARRAAPRCKNQTGWLFALQVAMQIPVGTALAVFSHRLLKRGTPSRFARGALISGNAGGSAASIVIPSVVAFDGRALGASYVFNNLIVKASYVQYKVAGSFNDRVYSGGASYHITPALNVDAGVWYTHDGNHSTNHSVMASTGVEYALSKATMIYGQVGFVNNHGAMHTGLSVNNALNEVTGTTSGVNVGIRHMF